MFKNLLFLLFVVLIGWVAYASMFGNSNDIELRNKLLSSGKDFGQSVINIFKSESGKVKSGTYDEVFKNLNNAINQLKEANKDGKYTEQINKLNADKEKIEKSIQQNQNQQTKGSDPNAENNEKLKKLAEEIVSLSKEMEN
jgi:hypothetical protein